jgi:hypothetical protein
LRIVRAASEDLRARRRSRASARLSRIWLALLAWRTWRRLPADPQAAARLDFPSQMRSRGVRMTEWLRDRLRPGWLRIRRSDSDVGTFGG